jgi:hypothetical protein
MADTLTIAMALKRKAHEAEARERSFIFSPHRMLGGWRRG